MNKKVIIKEIEEWQSENIIDEELAKTLKGRYSVKSNANALVVIFSVLGSLLIGAGIILMFAKNWYRMPISVKTVISFLPLVVGQGLAVYTAFIKKDSLAWREGVSVFWSAAVFASLAMVGQSFHIANDFATYILMCGIMILPIIYLLDAVAPLAVYFYAISNWAGITLEDDNRLFLVFMLLFAAGLAYVLMHRSQKDDPRYIYSVWVTVIAGFVPVVFLGYAFGEEMIAVFIFLYFICLLAWGSRREFYPFKYVGTAGTLLMMLLLSSGFIQDMNRTNDEVTIRLLFVITALAGAIVLGFMLRQSKSAILLTCVASAVCLIATLALILTTSGYAAVVLINLITLAVGIFIIVTGSRSNEMFVVNVGLAVTCALILLRFFDRNIDFFAKGVVFLIIGGALLLTNVFMLKKKKRALQAAQKEAEQK